MDAWCDSFVLVTVPIWTDGEKTMNWGIVFVTGLVCSQTLCWTQAEEKNYGTDRMTEKRCLYRWVDYWIDTRRRTFQNEVKQYAYRPSLPQLTHSIMFQEFRLTQANTNRQSKERKSRANNIIWYVNYVILSCESCGYNHHTMCSCIGRCDVSTTLRNDNISVRLFLVSFL